MTDILPAGVLLMGGVVLVLCRPLLEASRLSPTIFLLLGMALGPFVRDLLPLPVVMISGGWLILQVAGACDPAALRRLGPVRFPAACAGVGLAVAVLLWAAEAATGPDLVALPVLLTAAALALDPDAARHGLKTTARPSVVDRLAPIRSTVALGISLLFTVLWLPTAGSIGPRALKTAVLGIGLGLLFAGLLRLGRGKEQVVALLVCLPVAGAATASWLHLSAPALIFVAGLVLANDQIRRDLVSTCLRELERPFHVAFLFSAGVWLPLEPAVIGQARFWLVAIGFAVVRALAWRAALPSGPGLAHVVAMSPLVLLFLPGILSAGALDSPTGPAAEASILIVAIVTGEIAWFMTGRVRRASGKGGTL